MTRPLVIAHGKMGSKDIYIFGECHASVENDFYEGVFSSFIGTKNTPFFLVEHTTLFPNLPTPGDPAYSFFFDEDGRVRVRGSEWVWTVFNKEKNLICVDDRLKNKFLSRMEENLLMEIGPLSFLTAVTKTIGAAVALKEKFKEGGEKIYRLYIELMDVMKEQIASLISMFKAENSNTEDLQQKLVNNMIKISSLSVDANILFLLRNTLHQKRKDVYVCVGAAHAIRLAEYLDFEVYSALSEALLIQSTRPDQ
jgi:hypothetical protein